MKRVFHYLRIFINALFAFALILSVFLLVLSIKSPFRSVYIYKVMSGSMEPALHTGSIVITRIVKPATLKTGDIISYTLKNDETVTVTHRLVRIIKSNGSFIFTTKGDANKTADLDKISQDRLKGKVILTVPFLGYFLEWIKTTPGFIIAVVVPALYVLVSEAFVMKKIFEQSAVEKYKREEEAISKYLVLLVSCSILFGVLGIGKTHAYFSDGAVFSNVTISTGVWALPCKPGLISPGDKDLLTEGMVTFKWGACTEDNVTYDLQIADNNNFKKIYDEKSGLAEAAANEELPHGSYWWHVRACSPAQCGDWTDAWKITVIPPENKQTESQAATLSIPTLEMSYDKDAHMVYYTLTGVDNYSRLDYELAYKSGELDEGLHGEEHVNKDSFDGEILLGTCSDKKCVYHENISLIHLVIRLYTKKDGQELVLEKNL